MNKFSILPVLLALAPLTASADLVDDLEKSLVELRGHVPSSCQRAEARARRIEPDLPVLRQGKENQDRLQERFPEPNAGRGRVGEYCRQQDEAKVSRQLRRGSESLSSAARGATFDTALRQRRAERSGRLRTADEAIHDLFQACQQLRDPEPGVQQRAVRQFQESRRIVLLASDEIRARLSRATSRHFELVKAPEFAACASSAPSATVAKVIGQGAASAGANPSSGMAGSAR